MEKLSLGPVWSSAVLKSLRDLLSDSLPFFFFFECKKCKSYPKSKVKVMAVLPSQKDLDLTRSMGMTDGCLALKDIASGRVRHLRKWQLSHATPQSAIYTDPDAQFSHLSCPLTQWRDMAEADAHATWPMLYRKLFFLAVQGFELRALHLLDRRSTTWAMPTALCALGYFSDKVSCSCQAVLNPNPPSYASSIARL
jgi:hypothetical protein